MRLASVCGLLAAALMAGTTAGRAADTTLTIATVNNSDMIEMQKLSPAFEKDTGIKLNWVVLEENVLRQRVTTDIATKGGSFDIVTIGSYETPIWAKQGWLVPLDDFSADYDYKDLIPQVVTGLSYDGKMYSAPFYAESSLVFYRKDLFEKAGLKMADKPTYKDITTYAEKLNDKANGIYGICLRGKPGWGENMAILGTASTAFGGSYFDEQWKPQFTSEPWKETVKWYLDVMKKAGPPGATSNGYNENRALFATGKCGMWIDATVTAGYLYNPKESQVADKVAFAPSPVTDKNPKASGWFWAWSLGIPSSTKHAPEAKKFVEWATSKNYIKMVANDQGWVAAPPGTRLSTYANADYQKAAPFADFVLKSLQTTDPANPAVTKVPYFGVQYAAIPEFQGIGTTAGQDIAAALAGQDTGDQALAKAQASTERTMKQAGYPKK